MPRTVDELLAHAGELAARFESYEPNPADELDANAVVMLRTAVAAARESSMSWSAIGSLVGTTGDAVRQRYSGMPEMCPLRRRHY